MVAFITKTLLSLVMKIVSFFFFYCLVANANAVKYLLYYSASSKVRNIFLANGLNKPHPINLLPYAYSGVTINNTIDFKLIDK